MRYISWLVLLTFCLSCQNQADQTASQESWRLDSNAFNEKGLSEFFSWSEDRIPLVSAHRGGPYPGYPENSIEAFEHISAITPAVIECDVAITKDSVLVMMHDNTLERTTNGNGIVLDHTWEELQELFLTDINGDVTSFKIPTLDDVLEWGKGKALFTIDVKRGVPWSMVIDAIEEYEMEDFAAVITYNADAAAEVYQLNPDLMISVGIGNEEAYDAHHERGIPDQNMIAFVGVSEPSKAHYQFLHKKKISTILGVLGNLDKQAEVKGDSIYSGFVNRGADVLATDRPIEAAKVIAAQWPKTSDKYKFLKK